MKIGSFAKMAVAVAVLGGPVVFAIPAQAADTTVAFGDLSGALTITVPATSDLGAGSSTDPSIGGQLGPVTVTDLRAGLDLDWTATVTATDFTTGGGTPAETIHNDNVSYAPGPALATTGTGTFTPGPGGAMSASVTAFSLSGGTGDNSATWNPTLTVTLPGAVVGGIYTGTITHSAA